MNEEWRDIPGYEGLYQVSNLGRVKSLEKIDARGWHRKEKILVQIDNMHGYYQLMLYKNKNKKKISVHRLVALAFIPNPNNYPCVNHKDENKHNNNADNLEWCTHKYNNNYGTTQERRINNTNFKERTKNTDYSKIAAKNSKKVYQYTIGGELVKVWESETEIVKYYDSKVSITTIIKNKRRRKK